MADGRCDAVEKAKRVEQVEQWILQGLGVKKILRLTSDWQVTRRQIESYVAEAWENLHDCTRASLQENITRQLKRLDSLIYRAIQKEDMRAEAKGIELQNKILGLEKVVIETVETPAKELSTEELHNKWQENRAVN